MKNPGSLKTLSKKELLELAREAGLRGRSRMTKEELVTALSRTPATPSAGKSRGKPDLRKRTSVLRSELSLPGAARPSRENPAESFQQEVERGRFDLGREAPAAPEPLTPPEELPAGYGDDRIVLLVRDPYWIYSYWEVQEGTVARALEQNGLAGENARPALRVYLNGESEYQDIEVEGLLNNWYINVGRPDTEFFVDFGVRVRDRFLALVRSNRVRTPLAGMSSVIDDQWVCLEEEARTLYALSGGYRMGEGSLGLQERMERRLLGEISSGAVSSFFGSGRFRERPRGFWYHLDAELIVYGATEPDAKVTLQGRPIALRPDGTFTARFALPDGRQTIPVTFLSADEVDRVTVEPKVSRRTDTH